tara:strand:+ start:238 stop:417 length:180 start_codon:yes stop_codon:yes gene_type:complete
MVNSFLNAKLLAPIQICPLALNFFVKTIWRDKTYAQISRPHDQIFLVIVKISADATPWS